MAISIQGGGSAVEEQALKFLSTFGDPHSLAPEIKKYQKARSDAEEVSTKAESTKAAAEIAQRNAQSKLDEVTKALDKLASERVALTEESNAYLEFQAQSDSELKAREEAVMQREKAADDLEKRLGFAKDDIERRYATLEAQEQTIKDELDALLAKKARLTEALSSVF